MNKFLPPKPEFRMELCQDYSTFTDMALQFHDWYDKEIVPMFERAVEIYGHFDGEHFWPYKTRVLISDTHKALLINIKPIKPTKEESADDILRDLAKLSGCTITYPAIQDGVNMSALFDRAKVYLEKKGMK